MLWRIQPDTAKPRIAIIGGGASGTLTAIQLLHRAAEQQLQLQVTLIDRHARHGQGMAYSTNDPAHLLNATAIQMSAIPDDPEHLLRWAGAGPAAFLPRHQYGQYLQETLAEAQRKSAPWASLTRLSADVLAIRPDQGPRAQQLILKTGHLDADIAVLATGHLPAALPFPAPASDRIITDPWLPGALDPITDGSPVVIAGTGLTMLDLAMTITAQHNGTKVHAFSRHGLLPRPHPGRPLTARDMWLPALASSTGPVRLSELMWQLRLAIASDPANWADVIRALRPFVPGLWHRMPDADKRQFLKHVARYWEVHRHLMPPATTSKITTLRCTGQLAVHQGQISSVAAAGDQLRITIRSEHRESELTAGWLINGTGPGTDIAATGDALLRSLFASGIARPDPVGLGLDASTAGSIISKTGRLSEVLFTLGPPLRGLWYETTAIPEIRLQAAALARRILSTPAVSHLPGNAA